MRIVTILRSLTLSEILSIGIVVVVPLWMIYGILT